MIHGTRPSAEIIAFRVEIYGFSVATVRCVFPTQVAFGFGNGLYFCALSNWFYGGDELDGFDLFLFYRSVLSRMVVINLFFSSGMNLKLLFLKIMNELFLL